MDHITAVVKHFAAAIAFVAAAFIAFWAMTIIMTIISWLLIIAATLAAGYYAYEHVREHGVSMPSMPSIAGISTSVTSLFARFTTKAAVA